MKKIFTLFALVLMAAAVKAQEPLYTITATVSNDATWGEEYASLFVLQGTSVNIDVYEGDYVIIRNWAGAEGCDLKVEYDSNIEVNDDCNGNILAVTAYINGVEQEPLTYTNEYEDTLCTYFDFATGREDYAVASATLNEDGTFGNSFIEIDHENKSGYFFLTAYFMSKDYDKSLEGYYYNVDWSSDPVLYGSFLAEVGEMLDEDGNVDTSYGVAYIKDLSEVSVDVYDQYIIIHDWSKNPDSPRDLKLACAHDDDQTVTALSYIKDENEQVVPADVKYIYTGYPAEEGNLYDILIYLDYCMADWDETKGYAMIYGYPYYYTADLKYQYGAWGYYYIWWGYEEEEDAIAAIKAAQAKSATYNLAGQKVGAAYKGIVIRDGKKTVVK